MTRLVTLVAIVCAAGSALAQPMDGQMPDPRQMSGQARPQEGDPAGQLVVRAVQGKFRVDDLGNRVADWPKDAVIHLVAYDGKGGVTVETKPVDAEGRAVFTGLSTDGAKAYRPLAVFRRTGGEDRLVGQMIVMPPQVGMRVMLAGEPADSTAPGADDHTRSDEFGDGTVPAAGEVLIRVRGQTQQAGPVHLVKVGGAELASAEAILNKVVVGAKLVAAAPVPEAALRDGLVQVKITRAGDPADAGHSHGVVGAVVELRDAAGPPERPPLATVTTGGDGVATFERLAAGKRYAARVLAQGARADLAAIELPRKGGVVVPVSASWNEATSLDARFPAVPAGPDAVYYAWLEAGGRRYLSIPFQLTGALGAASGIFVYPDLVFSFHGGSELDDQRMFFQVQISLINPTNSPRDVGPDGLVIPLPRGFRAASVEEKMAARVKVTGAGLVWRGPLPPGQRDFIASYALDVEGGTVTIDQPLPMGAWSSQMVFEDLPGMRIEVPASAKQERRQGDNGRSFVVLGDINIQPGRSMVVNLHGLPRPDALTRWAQLGAGFAVLGLLGLASVGVLRAVRNRPATVEDERERLFGELVGLEDRLASKKIDEARYGRERAKLVDQLATLTAATEGGPADTAASASGEP